MSLLGFRFRRTGNWQVSWPRPNLEELRGVSRENAHLAQANEKNNWHLSTDPTHAVVFERLLETKGYLLQTSAEAGSILLESFVASGKWDIAGINIGKLLDSAGRCGEIGDNDVQGSEVKTRQENTRRCRARRRLGFHVSHQSHSPSQSSLRRVVGCAGEAPARGAHATLLVVFRVQGRDATA